MFDHRHYVPILKGRLAEYGALQALGQKKSHFTPLLEVPQVPWDFENEEAAKSVDEHLRLLGEQVRKSWGTDRQIFVDLLLIPQDARMKDGRHPVTYVFDELRKQKVQAIPVTSPSRDADYQSAVAGVVAKDRLGACVRLEDQDFEDESELEPNLRDLLKSLGLRFEQADLVIDLKSIRAEQVRTLLITTRSLLTMVPLVSKWRTLTLAATAFPENLGPFPSATISTTPRAEWTLWSSLVARPKAIPRIPTFGDYAIQHPEMVEIDPRIMQMTANLRYTVTRDWMILKARTVKKYGYSQFNDICKQLVTLPEYAGTKHCWGCEYVDLSAKDKEGPGNATTWRKVGTVHHLTFVIDQIANFPWP